MEVGVKIKLKKLKMNEVHSSYIVFHLPTVGWWKKARKRLFCSGKTTEVNQHHSSENEQLIGIFYPN